MVCRRTADRLNRYTQRTVPGYVEVIGAAHAQASVSVNTEPAERKNEYFRRELAVANSATNAWVNLTTSATWGNSNESQAGSLFVPKTPELFQYDLDGNLTNDGRWIYNWDAENRITQMISTNVVDGARKKLNFEYDYRGRRTRKTVSDPNGINWNVVLDHRFVYDGWNLLAELNASNNVVVRSYMWGTDLSGTTEGAGGVGGLLAVNDSVQGLHFTAYDGNGNIVALVKGSDGTVSATYEYGPFGELIRASGPMARANPFRFSTKYTDDESDLVYYGYRYYNPSTGRWLSRDPIEEVGGVGLYTFTLNNPIEFVDPYGLCNLSGLLGDVAQDWLKKKIGDALKKQAAKTAAKAVVVSVADGPLPAGEVVAVGLGLYDGIGLFVEIKALKGMSKQALRKICERLAEQMNCLTRPKCCAEAEKIIRNHVKIMSGSFSKKGKSKFVRQLDDMMRDLGKMFERCCKPCKTAKHHSDPKYLRGKNDQDLTDMERGRHYDLHGDMDRSSGGNFARAKKKRKLARKYGAQEMDDFKEDFYRENWNKYPDAGCDYFLQKL